MIKKMTMEEKQKFLNASMEDKLNRTKALIIDWYEQFEGQVYVSFSGGKDSTVLLHIVRSLYPDVPAVFADTGLEYPEIKEFVKTIDNVTIVRPKKSFKQVLDKYGFPIISKEQTQYISEYQATRDLYEKTNGEKGSKKLMDLRWNGKNGRYKISEKWKFIVNAPFKVTNKCCDFFKKEPFKRYEKETNRKPFVGVMSGESNKRSYYYLHGECNAFKQKNPQSRPVIFWNDVDVWKYMRDFDVKYSEIYNKGYERTGCMFCMYGLHQQQAEVKKGRLDKDRFELMKETHPKLFDYCMNKLGLRNVIKFYTGKDYVDDE